MRAGRHRRERCQSYPLSNPRSNRAPRSGPRTLRCAVPAHGGPGTLQGASPPPMRRPEPDRLVRALSQGAPSSPATTLDKRDSRGHGSEFTREMDAADVQPSRTSGRPEREGHLAVLSGRLSEGDPMTKTDTTRRRICQTCGLRQWCAITFASGLRRCFVCWATAYARRASTN